MDEKTDPAVVRAATRLFLAQRKISQEQFRLDSNAGIDGGAFSKFLSGKSDDTKASANISKYLATKGYIPLDGPNMTYRSVSRFFHNQSEA